MRRPETLVGRLGASFLGHGPLYSLVSKPIASLPQGFPANPPTPETNIQSFHQPALVR